MHEYEDMSALIGNIYDASMDSDLWIPTLARIREFVGGYSTTLFTKDSASKTGQLFFEEGKIEQKYKDLYFNEYVKYDPLTTAHVLSEIGVPAAIADHMPYEEFVETRFCKEWVRPQGIVDFASVVLNKSGSAAEIFGVFHHECDGRVSDKTRRKLRLIAPHLRRAVLVSRTMNHAVVALAGLADTLDGLSAGVFLVDESRQVVHANASGQAMLASGEVVRGASGRLTANDPKSDQALRTVLAAASMGDAAIGVAGITHPLSTRNGECYVAHVMPLTSGARRRTGKHYAAVAALFVHKGVLPLPSAPEVIARFYKLTASELRVLLAIVQIGGVPETAEALGMGVATVRTHLQGVFTKTGTNRQADLVKLVAGFANPFVDELKANS